MSSQFRNHANSRARAKMTARMWIIKGLTVHREIRALLLQPDLILRHISKDFGRSGVAIHLASLTIQIK